MEYSELIKKAHEAKKYAYTKYSKFNVGAALLTKAGKVYLGCNIENASFGATICAERTAFVKAISEGERDFAAIAIVANDKGETTYPCGICRQFMAEWNLDLDIILEEKENLKIVKLRDILPGAFTEF